MCSQKTTFEFKDLRRESLTVEYVKSVIIQDIEWAQRFLPEQEHICFPKIHIGKKYGKNNIALSYQKKANFYYVPNIIIPQTSNLGKKYLSGVVTKISKHKCIISTKNHHLLEFNKTISVKLKKI